ncbi:hypothetical protein PHYPSEUDO_006091 [Phytophthora pseudosyringae]|uniref:Transmembrane protein n=1 Tax=Phytophthora pseudosyringae TaxID=221518 RepID=A0A8T1WC66_9STRA|nr:hypothetical protein PHYPSEUDO_006091 [Phytophthora pseudosyringae]
MAKKRRHVAAPAAYRASAAANREVSVDYESIAKTLDTLGGYYDQLSADVVGIPASLERTLLLHSLVVLVVQNAHMVVQSVSTAQIALAVGSAVWLTRKSFVAMFLPHVAFQAGSGREVALRSMVFILTLGGVGTVYYRVEEPLNTLQLAAFAVLFLLDVVSMYFVRSAKGRLTRRQVVLSAVEVTNLVACFSICQNYKKGWIYDDIAFALTAATAFVHVVVLLTAKYVVLCCFSSDTNGAFVRTQQRGAKLMEDIWQDIDRFEPKQLLLGTSKKKKTKSKFRAGSSKTVISCSDGSADPALQKKQSVFKEPSVQLAILTLFQMLLLVSQLVLSAFVIYSWEMISALMLSSSHVLWTLGQVRRKVLSRRTIGSAGQRLKTE